MIDRQREDENVYFLNAVTENDLMDLAEKNKEENTGGESAMPAVETCSCATQCEAGKVDTACPVCKNDLKSCAGEPGATETPEETQPEKPKKGGGAFLFILLAAFAVGGAGYYLKVYKPKHDLDDAEDLDDLLEDEDEAEINEDEEEKVPAGTGETGQSGMDAAFYDDYPEDDYSEDGGEQEG